MYMCKLYTCACQPEGSFATTAIPCSVHGGKEAERIWHNLFCNPKMLQFASIASILLGMAVRSVALRTATTVTVYSSSTSGFLDQTWDPNGSANLQSQLHQIGINVAVVEDGQPQVVSSSTGRPAAFLIPAGSGDNTFTETEDVGALSMYAKSGGLIVVHGSMRHQDATQNLVATILEYEGAWQHCELITDSTRQGIGSASRSSFAERFLDVRWPAALEDASYMQVHSWCKHEDPDAVSYPLYTLGGNSMKVVVQAFSKVGSPGAVLWLGYSWQDGPQEGWGSMLREVINAFATGMYTPPADASAMESYPLRLDAVMDAVTMLADETSDAIRRLLYGVMLPYSSGHYIPGGYYGGLYGGYFGGYYGGLYGGYYGGYYGGGHYSLAPMYPQKSDLLMSQLGFPTGHTAQQLTAPAALRGSQTTIPAMQPFPSPGATSSPPPVPQTPSEFQAPQPSSPQWSRSRPKRNRSPHHYNRRLVRN